MQQAKQGDTVQVHYRGTLDDGSVFDSSEGREPLSFTIGSDQVIAGFENAIIGMAPGEKKTERIAAENAYGPHRLELIVEVDKNELPPGSEVEIGDWLRVMVDEEQSMAFQVTGLEGDTMTLDANHPLAGKDLTFELQLVAIS